MLKLMDLRMFGDYSVFADSDDDELFYVMPKGPSFAGLTDPDRGVRLRFIEYEQLRITEDDVFGGFVVFTTDLAVPEADLEMIRAGLADEWNQAHGGTEPPIFKLSPPQWTSGTVSIDLEENGTIVERISKAARPALYGHNVACFAMELTDIGTPVMKTALSEGANSIINVRYDLQFLAQLPPSTAKGVWHASKFYEFVQEIDTEDNFWSEDSYTETVRSERYNREVQEITGTTVDNPNLTPQENAELSANLRAAVQQQLSAMVERNLITAMADVDPNVKGLNEGQDIEDIKRTITSTQVADIRVEFTETRAITVTKSPQDQLPTIVSLKGPDGQPLNWDDYYSKISADEFFRDKRVNVRVNADFDDLPIFSVVVNMAYPHSTPAKTDQLTFTSVEQVQEFEALVVDGHRDVEYTYTVNYDNSSFSLTSERRTEDGDEITVGVDDLGILAVDFASDGIDFAQVARAQVHISYSGAGTPVDKTFNLTQGSPTAKVREIIQHARNAPVAYDVTYTMTDGREVQGKAGQIPVGAKAVTISDPFSAPKTVTFQAAGDLENDIASITLDATYTDAANDYVQRTNAVLSNQKPAFQWTFPTIDDTAGSVTYSGFITRRDGTTEVIEETTATGSSILVGTVVQEQLTVTVDPTLLDWNRLKLVLVSLTHVGKDGEMLRKDFTFKDAAAAAASWVVPLEDSAQSQLASTTTFFLLDGTRQSVGPVEETMTTLFPELPTA